MLLQPIFRTFLFPDYLLGTNVLLINYYVSLHVTESQFAQGDYPNH